MTAGSERWNHNIHYHPVLLAALPNRCERALDVGCGEGALARELRRSVAQVSAIDPDEDSIRIARDSSSAEIDFLLGDFLTFPFEPSSFDYVVCVAALHHMNADMAINRMIELLRPGGTLAILGLARSSYPVELPRDLSAAIVDRALRLSRRHWESSAPTVWPPPHTYAEIRDLSAHALPDSRFRRHMLWRYSIVWTKPNAVHFGPPRSSKERPQSPKEER